MTADGNCWGMGRLIDVHPLSEAVPPVLAVTVGDVLRVSASGGQVREGTSVERLGVFLEAVVGTSGEVVAPAGAPNVVLFHARSAGGATIEVVVGEPWGPVETLPLTVEVTAP